MELKQRQPRGREVQPPPAMEAFYGPPFSVPDFLGAPEVEVGSSGLCPDTLAHSAALEGSSGPPNWPCLTCSKVMPSMLAYEMHMKQQHAPVQCPYCLGTLSQSQLSKHLFSRHKYGLDPDFLHSQNLSQCPTCLKVLNASYIQKHYKSLHEPHLCVHCTTVIQGEKAWERHMRELHHEFSHAPGMEGGAVWPLMCAHCTFATASRTEYEIHVALCPHTGSGGSMVGMGDQVICEMSIEPDPCGGTIDLGRVTSAMDPITHRVHPIFVPVQTSGWSSQAEKLCAELNPGKRSGHNRFEVPLTNGSVGYKLSGSPATCLRDLNENEGTQPLIPLDASPPMDLANRVHVKFPSDCPTVESIAQYRAPTRCPTNLCHLCGTGFETRLELTHHMCLMPVELVTPEEAV
eukprot:maker-scaffold98_size375582-snap-gene-0.14 protein:Tk06117 transcript:maker-scaffold98_size375582-snap-gene-0.14-mRNA-1 annotation:"GI21222"